MRRRSRGTALGVEDPFIGRALRWKHLARLAFTSLSLVAVHVAFRLELRDLVVTFPAHVVAEVLVELLFD
jgi:hypothetical protein